MARILLAEALPVTRERLQQIIAANRDMLVAGHAGNAQELLREVSKNHYDLLLLGTSLPGRSWLDILKELKSQRPGLPVLLLSSAADEEEAVRAFRAGASGYLTAACTPAELYTALKRILSGGTYISGSLSERLALLDARKPLHELLSDREYEVMRFLASGKTVTEIAAAMSLSVKTISTYRSRLLEKLNLKNNVELAHYYSQHIATPTVHCKSCGQENAQTARFCTQCGAALEAVARPSFQEPGPAAGRGTRSSSSFLKKHRWFAVALVPAAGIVIALILWQTHVAPAAVELKHDDGTPETEVHADSGGYLVHFSPPDAPFVVEKIRVYGATLPSDETQFEVQIWDQEQKVIYAASHPLTLFPAAATAPEARTSSRWVDIPVPKIEVKDDFQVHLFAASSLMNGLHIGVDDSTWNLHSNLTTLTAGGTYAIRDGWGYSAAMWWSDKSKVNWMIRVLGRTRGTSATTPPTTLPPSVTIPSTGPTSQPAQERPLPPLDAFMKGTAFADWKSFDTARNFWGLYQSPYADRSLRDLATTGTNWILLLVNIGQETVASTTIFRTQPRTATDAELRRMVDLAHSLGMRVMLVPSLDFSKEPTRWRGEIGTAFSAETQWQEWFASYRELVDYYAAFGQEAGIDALCVGNQLAGTIRREEDWRRTVAEVRQRFKGPITYNSILGEDANIQWWDAVDYIGIEPYFQLTDKNDPTVAELKAAWTDKGYITALESRSKQFDRPVILKLAYESKDGANRLGATYSIQLPLDLQEQADCYQAALEVLWDKPWLKGIFWWQWSVGQLGAPNDTTCTPFRKPAEEIVKRFYLAGGQTSP